MIVLDDRYEPDPAIANTEELVRGDRVLCLFDYVGTPTLTRVLPLLEYYSASHILNVAPFTGAEPQRHPPYDRFVINIRASYADETRMLVEYLYHRGFRRIGFLGQADAYGKSGEVGVTQALATFGLPLVGVARYRRNAPSEDSMREQVAILRRAGADAVIAAGVYGPCAAFIRDARMAGWNAPIANVSFVGADRMLQLLKIMSAHADRDLTGGLINSEVVPPPSDTHYRLVEEFRARGPREAQNFVGLEGWLNAAVLTEALVRAGPEVSRRTLHGAFESLGGWDPGIGVRLDLSPTSHIALHSVWLLGTSHGEWASLPSSPMVRQ